MNDSMNTSVRKKTTAQRVALGAASLVTAGALAGVGAQGAFAATGDHGVGAGASGSTSGSTSGNASGSTSGSASLSGAAGLGDVESLAHGLLAGGHVNGAKAQALAERLVADTAVFDLLPDALQSDLKALADAPASERAADARKIAGTALDGGYGTAVQHLAERLKAAAADRSQAGDLAGLLDSLRSGGLSGPRLGAAGATVAAEVTADAQLSANLPESLRADLADLAAAPAGEQTADVQKIATTAVGGGYGDDVQQLAGRLAQQFAAGH